MTDAKLLRYAARAGDEALLFGVMTRMIDLDEEGPVADHRRALQAAAIGGHLSVVKQLLASGANPNLESSYSTALVDSVEGGNLEIARALIAAGAEVTDRALETASRKGNRDFVKLFVSHGVDASTAYYALLSEINHGNYGKFLVLLEIGADVYRYKPDPEVFLLLGAGISLLQAAVFGGSVNIVRYLLDNGFELEAKTQTPLLTESIRYGHVPTTLFLLNLGADVNAPPTSYEELVPGSGAVVHGNVWPPQAAYDTPLSAAIKKGNCELARLLLGIGALADPKLPITCGTPLLFAVWEEHVEIVRLLLEKGAPANQPGTIHKRKKPSYPILIAAEKGNVEVLSALLVAGATINHQDSERFSATHVAAGGTTDGSSPRTTTSSASCLRTLVCDHRANFSLRLQNGRQPIHFAASHGDAERLQILVDVGADINARDQSGRTPLHWAADVELLLKLGADAMLTADDDDLTAWGLMCQAKEKGWNTKRSRRVTGKEENIREDLVREMLDKVMVTQRENMKEVPATREG